VYEDALDVVLRYGDAAGAKVLALRASNGYKMCEGEDEPNTVKMKGIADDPIQSKRWKENEKGSRTLDDIPRGLSDEGFDDWLWMNPLSERLKLCCAPHIYTSEAGQTAIDRAWHQGA
jgi:hypothetical protein